jgi:hypothetical protein
MIAELRLRTGDAVADRVLGGFIGICDLVFPGRVRAYYLTGSTADGTAVRTPGDALNSSDIDLTVVFAGTLSDSEAVRFSQVRGACEQLGGLGLDQLDASAVGETALFRDGDVTLKTASRLLLGQDIRDAVPLPRPEEHIRRAIRISTDVMAALRGTSALQPTAALTYPDPGGEFYGYDFRDERYGGVPGTRLLIDGLTWGATAVLAIQTGLLAGTKRDAIRLHREHVNDEWSALLVELYERSKLRWWYGIPQRDLDRQLLRRLCGRVLALERYLLDVYRSHRERLPGLTGPVPGG